MWFLLGWKTDHTKGCDHTKGDHTKGCGPGADPLLLQCSCKNSYMQRIFQREFYLPKDLWKIFIRNIIGVFGIHFSEIQILNSWARNLGSAKNNLWSKNPILEYLKNSVFYYQNSKQILIKRKIKIFCFYFWIMFFKGFWDLDSILFAKIPWNFIYLLSSLAELSDTWAGQIVLWVTHAYALKHMIYHCDFWGTRFSNGNFCDH